MELFDDEEEANDRFDDAGAIQQPQMSTRFQKTQETMNNNFSRTRRGSVSAESVKPEGDEDASNRVIIPKSSEAKMRIASAISNNLLFRNLEDDQRKEIVDAMFEKKVPSGTVVIKQGEEGDNFYVVDCGKFDVFVNEKKVVEIHSGGSFGELALMYNTARAATVREPFLFEPC
jgi:cAMP-dependent protein kinase regulator